MTNQEHIDWIERYFSGELDSHGLQDFQDMLEQNPDLAQEFKLHKIANAILMDEMLIKEKHNLATQINYAKLNRKIWLKSNKWYIIIASILLIATSIILVPDKATSSLPSTSMFTTDTTVKRVEPILSKSPQQEETISKVDKKQQKQSVTNTAKTTLQDVKDSVFVKQGQQSDKLSDVVSDSVQTIMQDSKGDDTVDDTQHMVQAKQNDTSIDYDAVLKIDDSQTTPLEDIAKPCVTLSAELEIIASCQEETNGEIHVLDQNENYTYSIDGEQSTDFLSLSAGSYLLEIKDQNNCLTQKEIYIDQKQCVSHDYIFNKAFDSEVNFHLKEENGTIRIIHVKTGREVIHLLFDNGEPSSWDGQDSQGISTPTGYYLVLINYQSGENVKGTLTISE